MPPHALAFLATALLAYGLFSEKLRRASLTPPMAFVAVGLILGPFVLDIVPLRLENHALHMLAEVTLVVILFSDASRMNVTQLRRSHDLPVRLLTIGLPLTVLLGAAAAWGFLPGLLPAEAFALAIALAPTDAALGQAVVTEEGVPVRVRQSLNVESGLNDGLVLPLLLIAISFCEAEEPGSQGLGFWVRFALMQVTLGPLAGYLVGHFGGKLVNYFTDKGDVSDPFQRLSALALAVLAFALAESIHGNGFIATFTAGLTLGAKGKGLCRKLHEFNEAEGELLTLLIFLFFGAVFLPDAVLAADWRIWTYALLSLTAVRMLPVAAAMAGKRLRAPTWLFLGWFGPRGVASFLFALLVMDRFSIPGEDTLTTTVSLTVGLSVLLHGVTAGPLSNAYARWVSGIPRSRPEHARVFRWPLPRRLGGRRKGSREGGN
ncbi:cation:proton antiporter [Desulfohalovibrio reitneri]|uniref:cation:proton antiporter n=1 Tax=Desulfohalovibrio reitneri TaxID=1307759 RepID=UPI0004A6E024|nr:cation:proton antiporter [Desulfohalovibrio reitneri]